MSAVSGEDVIYSDQYFKFGQCLIGIISTLHAGNKIMLAVPQYKRPVHQTRYMPIFNSLRLKYGIYPGILKLENQNQIKFQSFEGAHQWHQMLPIVKCVMPYDIFDGKDVLGWKESVSLDYKLSAVENQVTNIVHRDTRNAWSRISLTENMALQEMNRAYSVIERPTANVELFHKKDVPVLIRDEDETNSLLPLLVGSFSSSKTKPNVSINIADISNYRILSESYGCENLQSFDPLETKLNIPPRSFMNQKTLTVPGDHPLKHGHATSSHSTDIRESSFSSIEPYPLPEAPSLLLLEPLLLMQQDTANESRTPMSKKHKRRKEQLTHSEQQKVARIMIGYTLAFFLLAIVTFYVVYFV